jgi:16S rRNA (guanine527-N7)-methyltransferase
MRRPADPAQVLAHDMRRPADPAQVLAHDMPDVTVPEPLVPAARVLFARRLPLAVRYAELLATDGVVRGLIGPREASRIWDRHLLNCAAVAEIIPDGTSVTDVGSGAGLPGIALALARPDLPLVLVDSLARRTAFLTEIVGALDLAEQVSVVRGRAEELAGRLDPAEVVTARAVAPLDRLAAWCLPLTEVGGRLLALKGAGAADEIAVHRAAVGRLGGGTPVIRRCGGELLDEPTTVVEIVRERVPSPAGRRSGARRRTR